MSWARVPNGPRSGPGARGGVRAVRGELAGEAGRSARRAKRYRRQQCFFILVLNKPKNELISGGETLKFPVVLKGVSNLKNFLLFKKDLPVSGVSKPKKFNYILGLNLNKKNTG